MVHYRWKSIFSVILAVFLMGRPAKTANVLAVFPYNAHSHFTMAAPIIEALTDRGHRVTVISPFPRRNPQPNYIDIDISDVLPPVISQMNVTEDWTDPVTGLKNLCHMNYMVCETAFAHPKVLELIKSPSKGVFDAVFTEVFSSDCFAAFAHKFGAPLISIRAAEASPHVNERAANPQNPAYLINHLLTFWPPLTFFERLVNAAATYLGAFGFHVFSDGPSTELVRRYFGVDTPPVSEIVKHTSLILVNSHHSLLQPRPFVPNVVEVGGVHIRDTSNTTNEWTEYCDQCSQGVVYVSFGSLLKGNSFPENVKNSFVKAFDKLPYCVLWKYEGDDINSERINRSKWMPQQSILSHKNVKVFITHGGLMGVMEAVHFGVPMIGIPVFGDQPANIAKCIEKGVAIGLDYHKINEHLLIDSIQTIIKDKKYQLNSKELSNRFRDRPTNPLDTAIYWTEYILKHNQPVKTISPAASMTYYQVYQLDIVLLISMTFILLIYFMFKIKTIFKKLIKL
ncbi:UDP-glucosyltransferase 2-like [Daktulosphaira vitifoliae]|uniref:UDP-glucosyltransferase 2-like n=1 Tax=Daktulosphaira vitifoliae TaxID=58002 RepID=UPI0021A9D47A|nr:UDP-glucosyltransferase 2-like [Daktulosphaira vitifoliae]XP_050544300.1 UDP-glucosyltransferase 2-like [Daktulosphaira vitifoliae]XP_050544306.1 UDP-glucosyltransferase 2-like [Daktulosphaira vitifoliae]